MNAHTITYYTRTLNRWTDLYTRACIQADRGGYRLRTAAARAKIKLVIRRLEVMIDYAEHFDNKVNR